MVGLVFAEELQLSGPQWLAMAMNAGMTARQLGHATHAHPTVSEVIKMAAGAAAAQCRA